MNQNRLFMLIGVALALIVVGAIVVFMRIRALTTLPPLTISYATVQTAMPEGATCAGGEETGGVAKEILNAQTTQIFVAAGDNPMPDDVWEGYNFRLPLVQNSTRNLLFQGSCFFRSPSASADCQGEACFSEEELEGYTWVELTTVVGTTCLPDENGCRGEDVEPGYVSINTIAKCHRVVFEGPVIYELDDGQGNRYVMHATATGTPDLTGPTLPEGWALTERTIEEPLVLLPFGGGDNCYYNVLRDDRLQSYHQYVYAGDQYPPQGTP